MAKKEEELTIEVHKMTVDDLSKKFNTDILNGLTPDQVAKGHAEHGPNSLSGPPPIPKWKELCCFCCFSIEQSPCSKQKEQSEAIEERNRNMVPAYIVVRRGGEKITIKTEELTLGDMVEIKARDHCPADLRIIESNGLKVDNSSLTGESEPKTISSLFTHENPMETENLVFMGCKIVEGSAVGMVYQIGDKTMFGRLQGLTSFLG